MVGPSDFGKCPDCGEYDWLPNHKCSPVFEVWIVGCHESRSDAWPVRAISHQQAAQGFAMLWDTEGAHYGIAHGTEVTVLVAQQDSDRIRRFTVRGALEPVYTAKEVK